MNRHYIKYSKEKSTKDEAIEADVQSRIIDWLKIQKEIGKLEFWRVPLGGVIHGGKRKKNPMAGMPDICGILKPSGRFFGIEVKRPKGGVFSQAQIDWALKIENAGALYISATCLNDVIKGFAK